MTFLAINGIPISNADERLYLATVAIAQGQTTKEDLAELLRQSCGDAA